tara:strand:+ start:510 stop:794 length:285 start_codon:yes stop_codon:yes gene_type:complete
MDEENPFEPQVQKDLSLAEGNPTVGRFTITVRDEEGREWSSKTNADGSLIIIVEQDAGKQFLLARCSAKDAMEAGSSLSTRAMATSLLGMLDSD